MSSKIHTSMSTGLPPGGYDGSMPSKRSDSSAYGRAGHVTVNQSECRTCRKHTHLNGYRIFQQKWSWIVFIGFAFYPSLTSQSFSPSPASHVVFCVLRCPKSLMKPPDMLSLLETPKEIIQHRIRQKDLQRSWNPSFLAKSRFESTKFRSLRSLSSLQEINYRSASDEFAKRRSFWSRDGASNVSRFQLYCQAVQRNSCVKSLPVKLRHEFWS